MKQSLILYSLALVMPLSLEAEGVFLRTGETYTFEFNSLPPDRSFPGASDQVSVGVNFDPLNSLHPGEIIRFRFFENSALELPFFSQTYNFPAEEPLETIQTLSFGPTLSQWADFQGVFEARVESGEVLINSLDIRVIQGAIEHRGVFAVPEPSALTLLFLAAILVSAFRIRARL